MHQHTGAVLQRARHEPGGIEDGANVSQPAGLLDAGEERRRLRFGGFTDCGRKEVMRSQEGDKAGHAGNHRAIEARQGTVLPSSHISSTLKLSSNLSHNHSHPLSYRKMLRTILRTILQKVLRTNFALRSPLSSFSRLPRITWMFSMSKKRNRMFLYT